MDVMSARSRRWLRRALLVSLAGHVAVVGALAYLMIGYRPEIQTKRGEPMMVELAKIEEPAPPLPPAAPAPPARVAPRREPPPRPVPPASATKPEPAPLRATPPAKPEPPRVAATAPPSPAPQSAPQPAPQQEPVAKAPEPDPAPAPPSPPARPSVSAPEPRPATSEPPRVAVVPREGGVEGPGRPIPDLRSLGRGGGVSGRSGWGGIEGEPIGLDSNDPKYNDYLDRVRRLIKANWSYPCVKDPTTRDCEYKTATLVVTFGILKDGRLQVVEVRRSSGFSIYDDYAVNAIKLASPFPAVPSTMIQRGSTGLPILATFSYIVENSLTNILR